MEAVFGHLAEPAGTSCQPGWERREPGHRRAVVTGDGGDRCGPEAGQSLTGSPAAGRSWPPVTLTVASIVPPTSAPVAYVCHPVDTRELVGLARA